MVKSKKISESDKNKEASSEEMTKNNGYYVETIKTQKKSFVSRILVPVFMCFDSILCKKT